ncbi:S-layer homology domain-containing protein [Natronospora cellulosivora (SeqCode)]
MKKKVMIMIITISIFLVLSVGSFAESFKDVPAEHWANEAIDNLVSHGIISGYSNEIFRGDQKLSRYEMAFILHNILDMLEASSSQEIKITIDEDIFQNDELIMEYSKIEGIVDVLERMLVELEYQFNRIDDIKAERTVVLNVEEKDPRIAYKQSLLPIFGPYAAANYVVSTPAINPYQDYNSDLKHKARAQMLFNIGEIGAGIILDIMTNDNRHPLSFTITGFAVAMLHNHFFGQEMAGIAAEYNRKLHDNFEWTYPNLVNINF